MNVAFLLMVSIVFKYIMSMIGTGVSLVCCLIIRSLTGGFHLLRYFIGVVLHPRILQVSQYVSIETSSLIHHRPYSCFVYSLCRFIDGLENMHVDKMFRPTTEAKGEGSDQVKLV